MTYDSLTKTAVSSMTRSFQIFRLSLSFTLSDTGVLKAQTDFLTVLDDSSHSERYPRFLLFLISVLFPLLLRASTIYATLYGGCQVTWQKLFDVLFLVLLITNWGRPPETLKKALTREAKLIDIKSLDKIEKLPKNRDSWQDTLRALRDTWRHVKHVGRCSM